nr:hypothetical protein [Tanacetum cinerariifolium]
MVILTFVDSHNMVAYLEKSAKNADFAEIVDFLNANPIRYALTSSGPTTLVADETIHEERRDKVERAATTASSLEAEHESEDAETRGRYGHDIKVNTASTSITTANINLTAAEPVTTVSAPITTVDVSEPEKPVKVKGKDQIALDEEVAQRLEAQMQAEFTEEERVIRQRK